MKRLASRLLIGTLLFTAICTGSLKVAMDSYAHDGGDMERSHAMEHESVNCCDDHEQEVKLFIQQSREEYEMSLKIVAFFPRENFLRLVKSILNHAVAERSAVNKTDQRLRTIVLLE